MTSIYDTSFAKSYDDELKKLTLNTAALLIPMLRQQVEELQSKLVEMEQRKDAAYLERNQVVAALAKCFPSGTARTAIEGWSDDWHGCVYIDLPTGQASWHYHDSQAFLFKDLPEYTKPWDGHDTHPEEKSLAFQYRDEQVAKQMQPFYDAFAPKEK